MELAKVAGLAMVLGALAFMIAAAPMPSIYGIQDADDRLAKIYANERAFLLSQAMFAVAAIVVATGFILLTVSLVGRGETVLPLLGATGVVIGATLWAYFMFDRATNPEGYFRDYSHVPTYVWASAACTLIGLASFGALFVGPLQPSWPGYLTLVVVVIAAAGAVLAPEVFPPQLLYVPPLAIGAVLLLATPSMLTATT